MGREWTVEARGLTRSHGAGAGRVDALRGVDLAIAPGEFVAITGPSGSGKTTLLHLLAGLDVPSTGSLTVLGTDLGALDEDGRTRFRGRHIGVVFQSLNLLDALTAEENVALPLALAGVPVAAAARRARVALDRVCLGARRRHLPEALSGGEQQRVAVARALVADPAVLIADEPTGSLDSANGRLVFDLLAAAAAAGRAVILVTHDADLAARADRVVRLWDGVVKQYRPPMVSEFRSGTEAA